VVRRRRTERHLLGRLREAGFSAEMTYHAYHVLDGHIFGFSVWETSHRYPSAQLSDLAAAFEAISPAADYPHLHEHGQQHGDGGQHHEVSAFQFGLDLILDGLKKGQSISQSTGSKSSSRQPE